MKFLCGFITFGYLLLFTACEEKSPVYSSPIDTKSGTLPDCLYYAIYDAKERDSIAESFGLKDSKSCGYRVELTKYQVGNCNNPLVKSIGSDFNGYIRIEIKKGIKSIYKIQSDYKSDSDAAFRRVLRGIKEIEK